MTTNIERVLNTPGLNRDKKATTAAPKQQKRSNETDSQKSTVEQAHIVELSPESISKAQKMVTGGGYIASSGLGDIDLTDTQALELSAEIARQMENFTAGLVQSPLAELSGLAG